MADPLSDVITLLRPRTVLTKGISGAGRWGVRYSNFGHPSFCTVVQGSCRLAVDGAGRRHARGGRFRAVAGDAGLYALRFRAGEAEIDRPERCRGADG